LVSRSAWSNDPSSSAPPQALASALQIALGGALGAGLRVAVGGSVLLSAATPGPLRLLAINVGGAFLLGVLLGALNDPSRAGPAAEHLAWWTPLLATGFLGGLTTFSAMIVQAGGLGHRAGQLIEGSARMNATGMALAAGYLFLSVGAGLLAFVIGRRVMQRQSAAGLA
jgi:CrcB protein